MKSAIVVVNGGSATLKLALYAVDENGELAELIARALVEQRGGQLAVSVNHRDGQRVLTEHALASTADLADPDGMLAPGLAWLRGELGERQILAFGHRVVHGGD